MPLSISSDFITEKNKLNADGVFLLLLLIEVSGESAIRLVNNINDNVTWPVGGNTWYGFPFKLGDIEYSKEGEIPTVSLSFQDLNSDIIPIIEDHDGIVGANVTVYVIHSDHTDNTDPELEIPFEIIETHIRSNYTCEFKLGAENLLNYRFPQHRYMKNFCRFQLGDTQCAYGGGETDCDGSFARCLELSNQARYGGFPGIPVGGIYV